MPMFRRSKKQAEDFNDIDSASEDYEEELNAKPKEKSRKPADNAFRQQRLKAYQ